MSSLTDIIKSGAEAMDNNPNTPSFGEVVNNMLGIDLRRPPVDILNYSDSMIVIMHIPGIKPENLSIECNYNIIKVSGDREELFCANAMKREIKNGHIERFITLPIKIPNKNSVKIEVKYGVLKITIDKSIEPENKFTLKIGTSK